MTLSRPHTVAEGGSLLDEDDLSNADNNPFSYQAVATDDPATEVVSLLLNGDDAAAFKLVDLDGAGAGVVYGLAFEEAPNFESPTDVNKDNALQGEGGGQRRRGQQGLRRTSP